MFDVDVSVFVTWLQFMEKFNELKDLVNAAAAMAADKQSNGADVCPAKLDHSQQQTVLVASHVQCITLNYWL